MKPLDYKPLVLALGTAVAFGLGVGYFKGSDSVRVSPPGTWLSCRHAGRAAAGRSVCRADMAPAPL